MFLFAPGVPEQKNVPGKHSTDDAVQVQMRNVLYHFQDNVAIHIRQLGGELVPTGSAELPVFEDKNSFVLHIDAAEIAIPLQSMANVLNQYVFARKDAPIQRGFVEDRKGARENQRQTTQQRRYQF